MLSRNEKTIVLRTASSNALASEALTHSPEKNDRRSHRSNSEARNRLAQGLTCRLHRDPGAADMIILNLESANPNPGDAMPRYTGFQ